MKPMIITWSAPVIYYVLTDRSKARLLLWFVLIAFVRLLFVVFDFLFTLFRIALCNLMGKNCPVVFNELLYMSRLMTKPTQWLCAQRRLGSAWASVCAQWVAKYPRFLHADSKDSDQAGRMPRLIWVFIGRTVTLLVLSLGGSFELLFRLVLRQDVEFDCIGSWALPFHLLWLKNHREPVFTLFWNYLINYVCSSDLMFL